MFDSILLAYDGAAGIGFIFNYGLVFLALVFLFAPFIGIGLAEKFDGVSERSVITLYFSLVAIFVLMVFGIFWGWI